MTREWQAAAEPAVEAGARVCVLRTAPVMDRRGAPLKQLRLLFRPASGPGWATAAQHMAMISLRDWVGAVAHLVEHDDVRGPVNLCCPQTPTNAEFTEALARALDRKAFLPCPRLADPARRPAGWRPRCSGSLNLRPAVLEAAGYEFRDRTVHEVVRAGLA